MKKITLSVAALALAFNSYSQSLDSTIVSKEAIKAKSEHENLYEIVIRAEDMLFQIEMDQDSGFILDGMGDFYVNLLSEIIKLAAKTPSYRSVDAQTYYDGYFPCENCDEID